MKTAEEIIEENGHQYFGGKNVESIIIRMMQDYAEQFKPKWEPLIPFVNWPSNSLMVYLWCDDGQGVDCAYWNGVANIWCHETLRKVLGRNFTHYCIKMIPEPPKTK